MRLSAALASLALLGACHAYAEDYLSREDFLTLAFAGPAPAQQTLWLTDEARQRSRAAVGLAPANLRVRYWAREARSAWVLEEIGKEQPITMGVVIESGQIEELRVLAFRESRGGEIRYAFFTDQFRGAALNESGTLDRRIDGITGATLSVRATDRVARLALWLDGEARKGQRDAPL